MSASKYLAAESQLSSLGIQFKEMGKGAYRIISQATVKFIVYYPSSSKWLYRGRVYEGTAEDLKAWLDKL